MDRSQKRRHLAAALTACAGVLALAALMALAESTPPASELERAGARTGPTPSTRAIASAVGGLKTYRDPVTGERRAPPRAIPLEALDARQRNSLSRSHVGLVEEAGPSSAGGVHVDLQGRFRSAVVVTKQPDGSFATRCLDLLPHGMRGE